MLTRTAVIDAVQERFLTMSRPDVVVLADDFMKHHQRSTLFRLVAVGQVALQLVHNQLSETTNT